ncbi:hypothetical protein [uncultured Paraglaciecola sp.]|uniref:hypothetical protein n=1 Tax=uncultured Paraglaciecola sp. TaxID=1765024 RepID=UPI0030D7669A|tara:strand:- start:27186 stop:28415 length:1230 start_codon:yes stop_codon:yes gene_type:complete
MKVLIKKINKIPLWMCVIVLISEFSYAENFDASPLFDKTAKSVEYVGGFRLPLTTKGVSRISFSQGVIALRPSKNSFFMIGHAHHQAVAEFEIPQISTSKKISEWHVAKFKQPFSSIFSRAQSGNPQKLNRVTGMAEIENQLVVNGMEYYDADVNVRDTTLVIRDPDNLDESDIDGFYQLHGAAHAAGWISKIPQAWQGPLNSKYLVGNASNLAINSRLSIGPSAFTVDFEEVLNNEEKSKLIATTDLMDFSIKHPIVPDQYNQSRKNDLWTELSSASYGFIIPGTSSYFVLGKSGGHNSGIGYKITQDDGRKCGGPCSLEAIDSYNYYWLFDVSEFLAVTLSKKEPYQIKPYQYGFFDTSNSNPYISGSDYDAEKNLLYVVFAKEDKTRSKYDAAPVIRVYKINTNKK